MAINKGLGKGLAALLQDLVEEENKNPTTVTAPPPAPVAEVNKPAEKLNITVSAPVNTPTAKPAPAVSKTTESEFRGNISEIDISFIDPNPNQPRKYFDDTALRELAASIKTYGILQPLILVKFDGRYIIVAGERRFRAAKIAGLKQVPAIIRELTPQDIKEIAIIENLQREDLNPIEAAEAIKELMTTFKMTQDELSQKIGKSRPSVTNLLRLLSLSAPVVDLVRGNKLSAGHARALVVIDNKEIQEKLANTVVSTQMSVRDLENRVKLYSTRGVIPDFNEKAPKEKRSKELKDMVVGMKRVFGTKVKIIGNDAKGRICIDYFSRDDLDRIYALVDNLKK
ncbi:MAG: ParB/RepB/Spo0J family partition protein [Clostridiales bacterium]|jgi:ParB family chromosome partitioning protein|nr:ParB/RepB/Spo0J family partition protein [Clostridiales bacterium]